MENGVTLETLVGYFDEAEHQTIDAREESELHRDYYDGKQLTDAEKETLNKRGQPPVIDNKVKDKIDTLLGMEIEVRTDPKAFPRTPQHQGAAEAATDGIRYVADNNKLPEIKSEVGNQMFVEGSGFASVTFEPKKQEVRVKHIMWDRAFFDPHSRRKDFSDAKYLGEAIWMDVDDAKRIYGDHAEEFEVSITEAHSQFGNTYADKPIARWVDPKRKRVRILEIYFLDGVWKRALIGRHSMIEGPEASVYLDEDGEPQHPYVSRSAYVDREGRRYGVVRRYKDLQDEHNKRRSKLLHLASAKTIVAEAGAVDNIANAKEELAKPDGFLVKNPGKSLDILTNDVEIATHARLLEQTDFALSQTGPNAALIGQSGDISGRAKQLDQQAGSVNLGTLFDGLRSWELMVYRKIWNCIQQFWDDERWIRVRDEEQNLKFVSLNHRKTEGEAFQELTEQWEAAGGESTGLPPPPPPQDPSKPLIDDNGNFVIENNVVDLDVDIIIEQAPDIVTVQQEQFAELTGLAQSGMVQIPADVIIEASSLRNKRQLLASLRGESPEAQQMAQMARTMKQIQVTLAKLSIPEKIAEIKKIESEVVENQAQAEKASAEAESKTVEAFQAGEGIEKIG